MRPIPQLQILRALAALVVVVFHIQGELRHRGLGDPFPDLTVGAFGVDLFFVISGFIMVYASSPLFGAAGARLNFMSKRLARIAPLYWGFTTVFALIAVVLARLPGHPAASPAHILASYLFVPAARPEDGAIFPTYSLGWTLNYEMFFYLCFAAAVGFRRAIAVPLISAALILLVVAGSLATLPWPLAYWSNTLTLEFVFGMLVAVFTLAGRRIPARIGLLLVAGAVAAVAIYVPYIDSLSSLRGLAWGLPAAAVVAAALGLEVGATSLPMRLMVRLGDASYSLYLVHSAFFIAAFALLSRLVDPHGLPAIAYALFLLAGSIICAVLLYRLFERPVTRRLHGLIGKPHQWRRRAAEGTADLLPSSNV